MVIYSINNQSICSFITFKRQISFIHLEINIKKLKKEKKRQKALTCYAKDHTIKQQPSLMAIPWEELIDIMWRYCLENRRVMIYDVVNSNKRSSQCPCTHNRWEQKARSCSSKFLNQKTEQQELMQTELPLELKSKKNIKKYDKIFINVVE